MLVIHAVGKADGGNYQLIERCDIDIDKRTISCSPVFNVKMDEESPDSPACPLCPVFPAPINRYRTNFHVLSDDESMVFAMEGDECVRIMKIGEEEAGCLTNTGYEIGSQLSISPDERWIAFVVYRSIEGPSKTLRYTTDIYAVRIKMD